MKTKPAIFVGSSSEALKLARAVADVLRSYFDVQVWDERLFELGEDTLKGLLRAVQAFDFAVLVISDDDTLTSTRNPSKAVPSTFGRLWAQFFPPTHHFASPPRIISAHCTSRFGVDACSTAATRDGPFR